MGAAAKQHLFLNLSFAHLTGGALAPGSPRARAPTRTAQQEWAIAARHFNGDGAATAARCRTWTSTRCSSWPRCCSRQRRLPPPPPSESLLNETGLVEGLVMKWLPQCSQVLSSKEQKMALATTRAKMALPLQEERWHCHEKKCLKKASPRFGFRRFGLHGLARQAIRLRLLCCEWL